jgi:hypothetical protein
MSNEGALHPVNISPRTGVFLYRESREEGFDCGLRIADCGLGRGLGTGRLRIADYGFFRMGTVSAFPGVFSSPPLYIQGDHPATFGSPEDGETRHIRSQGLLPAPKGSLGF